MRNETIAVHGEYETKARILRARQITRQINSVFFTRGGLLEFIKAGSSFRRVRGDNAIETAEVTAIFVDLFGIPHIKFDLSIERPGRQDYRAGARILALRTFCANYGERPSG